MQMMGVLAELERSTLIERVNAGIASAKRRGVHCGRPFRLNGEQIEKARILMQSESGASVARTFKMSRSALYANLGR